MIPTIHFIACHGGPADHFATYSEVLSHQGYQVYIHATGFALGKFQQRKIEVRHSFSLESLDSHDEDKLAKEIAAICKKAAVVLIDVGHVFDIKIQKALREYNIPHYAYYDNPEPLVLGGYSTNAAEVMRGAPSLVFANELLASAVLYSEPGNPIDLSDKKRVGIGYYPVEQAERLAIRRKEEHEGMRTQFLQKQRIKDQGQKILVYFGGNNEEYFSKAFPAFLGILDEAGLNAVVIIQQHPAAKGENKDGKLVETCKAQVVISDFSSDDAQVLADVALYYQTSMGPQFVIVGIPSIQIGHEPYEDILVRNELAASVTTSADLIEKLSDVHIPEKEGVLSRLGIRNDWKVILEKTFDSVKIKK